MNDSARKTSIEHWDAGYTQLPRMRVPSAWNVDVRNLQQLLRRHVRQGDRFLEVGCAPGKALAWAARAFGARVAGLDYSVPGLAFARQLANALGIDADLRCEDLAATSFAKGSFDVVYSGGLIEHFDDPAPIVREHVALAKPGGLALLTIPNYGGVYGRLQARLDPENLAVHNLRIMTLPSLRALAPADLVREVRTYAWGRPSPWILALERWLPARAARPASWMLNMFAQLQPAMVEPLCPMLVLEMRR